MPIWFIVTILSAFTWLGLEMVRFLRPGTNNQTALVPFVLAAPVFVVTQDVVRPSKRLLQIDTIHPSSSFVAMDMPETDGMIILCKVG